MPGTRRASYVCVSRFRDLYRAVPIVLLSEAQRHLHHGHTAGFHGQ